MSIAVDPKLCNGCTGAKEPHCVRVCPGNLVEVGPEGTARLREPRDCWDCASCVKACPREALALYLPAEIGGRGSRLKARLRPGITVWTLIHPDGTIETIEV